MAKKPAKKKFFEVEAPLINETYDILAYTMEDLENMTIKIDMTRKLRGKSLDLVFKILVKDEQPSAIPKKLTVLPYFIKHMLRKSISYVEDSFKAETKESNIVIKPFLITRKSVSRAVRKTLRNSAKNWILDYTKTKTDSQLFEEILSGDFQKQLSIKLKRIYPLSLCEVRILEIKTPLEKPAEKETEKKEKPEEAKEEKKKTPEKETEKEEKQVKPKPAKKETK